MNEITERIARLRRLMETYHMDAYLVPTADFHESEYVGEHEGLGRFVDRWSLFRAGGCRIER